MPASPTPPRRPGRRALPRAALLAIAAGAVPTVGVALILGRFAGGGPGLLGQAGLLYGLVALGILVGVGPYAADGGRFGPADWITLGRAALVCVLAGAIGAGLSGGADWLLASLGLLAFALDGLDGWVARRTGTSSDFGARFDREVDALFVLVLGLLLVDLRDVGYWVLLTGLLRYAFVAGRVVWPWLAAELPPSRRRKAVFAAQVLLLLVCLPPAFGPGMVTVLAATALAIVSLSFAVDVLWLQRTAAEGLSRCKGTDPG